MIRRSHFLEVGGLTDSLNLFWSWIDLCLKLNQQGKRVVSTPQVSSFHFDDDSETVLSEEAGLKVPQYFRDTWGHVLQRDPYSVFRPEQIVQRASKWRAQTRL
jgi:GT2 family glycosyltransferase